MGSETKIPILRQELFTNISTILNQCIDCPKCIAQCAFLKQYGTPAKIAEDYLASIEKEEDGAVKSDESKNWLEISYQCSLCGLCSAVCPVKLSPDDMFLEMRREAVDRNAAPLPEHKGITAYESRGFSKKYSWYSLPDGCTTVLFPGCTFTGTRPDSTLALYELLKTKDSSLGIVLDCCCKPSHDLGRTAFFDQMFGEMRSWLVEHGVKKIVVVCPNCYKVFKSYGSPLEVVSAYQFLLENGLVESNQSISNRDLAHLKESTNKIKSAKADKINLTVSIHDPCVLRNEPEIHNAVRELAEAAGFKIKEMPHSKKKTLCCGEGGSVGFVAPEFSSKWGEIRKKEAEDNECSLITYCAGCAGFLNKKIPTYHIIDALFYPESVAAGNRKVSKAPFTYLNRISLKKRLKKEYPTAVTRERDFVAVSEKRGLNDGMLNKAIQGNASLDKPKSKSGNLKKIMILALIAAAVVSIRFSGVLDHFDSETLRKTVADWGNFAPVIYILLYTAAPALFLPGLPITIVGGVIFGPVWGVVYSITGATAGASLAFLISRYIARDWIKAKLTGQRWKQLDSDVEKNGWKIVAFTRLVPLFPFNLLNYAFGLTSIKFIPYVVTSFLCMLPACIAFIVFSSSLVDLLKGNISTGLMVGVILIVIVSLIPVILKKQSKNEKMS